MSSVALVGNPNTGKTTLFNALTGLKHRVANYPGVTVEWKAGAWKTAQGEVELVDLPGTYSLRPRSADEAVVLDTLSGKVAQRARPDLALVILDASNLERNLYLLSQVFELGIPMVAALNMGDVAVSKGLSVDAARLSENLGFPVVAIQANKRLGLEELAEAVQSVLKSGRVSTVARPHQEEVAMGSSEDIKAHYRWIRARLEGAQVKPAHPRVTFSDRLDRVLVHKFWGTLSFLLVMGLVFESVFTWARPVMDAINALVSAAGEAVGNRLPEGAFKSLVVDGAIAGAGSVVVFVPQIAVLFFFIAVLEDCGYMARSAFLMDKLLSKAGLSGKSFIPMLSSFACAVPGIMSTRTIENWKDRIATMVVAPLMSCSARLPVYLILIAAFVPDQKVLGLFRLQGLTLLACYSLGVVVAIPVVWLVKRVWLKGEAPAFILELPSYKWPEWRTVFSRVYSQSRAFLLRAGTLIFCVAILVWALSYYPRQAGVDDPGERLRQSYMGSVGRAVEPVFKPLGWDWRISMAAMASFPAREVVVATLGTIFNLGNDSGDGHYQSLGEVLKAATWPDGRPLFTLATALSIMVFFALCCQCASTLAVMRQETGGWGWPAFTFIYMTLLAYVGAFLVYHLAAGW